ncbi:ECF transporter S component [Bacteroides sp. An322]|uniref:ECF transporter S component n=1 Tax=Bacteroides sp. An322 TaxID=1965632 RepID=UPI000B39856C|nr:ECF transporter S component [Bacteroides sp. An322]OUO18163.1 ECF transporter S component [Bacteroides sp. An322]
MESAVKLYSLPYSNVKTYGAALLFVIGNIALPQLFHLIPQGGMTWLPIYFFTLVGAYKYGWKVGLLTAIASPLINSALFGMPAPEVLPVILLKSVLLAAGAGFVAHRFQKVSVLALLAVVLFYQCVGTLGEWAFFADSFHAAVQDFRMGIPGMLLQIFGGYAFIRYLIQK